MLPEQFLELSRLLKNCGYDPLRKEFLIDRKFISIHELTVDEANEEILHWLTRQPKTLLKNEIFEAGKTLNIFYDDMLEDIAINEGAFKKYLKNKGYDSIKSLDEMHENQLSTWLNIMKKDILRLEREISEKKVKPLLRQLKMTVTKKKYNKNKPIIIKKSKPKK